MYKSVSMSPSEDIKLISYLILYYSFYESNTSKVKFGKYYFIYRAVDFKSGVSQVSKKGYGYLILVFFFSRIETLYHFA